MQIKPKKQRNQLNKTLQKIKRKKIIDDESDENEFKGKKVFDPKRHKRSKRVKDYFFCFKG